MSRLKFSISNSKGHLLLDTSYNVTLKYFQNFAFSLFMHGLSNEIKRICHHAQFFIISHESFQHFTNFLKIAQVLNSKLK